MTGATVSVLIPTYNRAAYLRECLESVLAQSLAPLEIIVVDDGSQDETRETVAAFGAAVRYFRKENGGKPSAINFALPQVRGEMLWIFDDDDVALPDSIERRVDVLERRPYIAFVVSGHYLGSDGPDGRIVRGQEYRLPQIDEAALHLALMKGCFVTMQSMLVRTHSLRRIGDVDPQLVTSEDYDLMLRLAATARFALLHRPTFIFRQHEGIRGPQGLQYAAERRARIFRHYDAVVGRKLRASLPLSAYLVPPGPADSGPKQIEALLSRMEVMASKGLIREMFEDLGTALRYVEEAGGGSIDARLSRCANAVCVGYAYYAIADDFPGFLELVDSLRTLPHGRAAMLQMARGLVRLAKSYPGSVAERSLKMLRALRVAYRTI